MSAAAPGSPREVALVVGAGSGLGAALARCFAQAGMAVAVASRNRDRLAALEEDVAAAGGTLRRHACDATDESQVQDLFARVQAELGMPALVVYNASARVRASVLDLSVADFEHTWRGACLGGFLVGREAARRMLAGGESGRGTILFTGATASLRGGAGFAAFAAGKSGLRALAQSMARELGPRGLHVAHVVIDGQIESDRPGYRAGERGADAVLAPDAIAATYLHLHRQERSAWTLEADLRPWVEKF